MITAKLTQPQIKPFVLKKLEEQNGICPVCQLPILKDPVGDHDYGTGHMRDPLHRHCNSLEGKIINWANTFGKSTDIKVVFENLLKYWAKDFSHNPYHYKHKTDIDIKIKKLKALAKSAKRPETIAKHEQAIKELKKQVARYKL
ncbi:hypothetical protein CJF42_03550 [Pseudoalteromonas sp. NBT06-2]|uniref:endonuclease domain-containing protein n=1 Tax=Pseudoalteromonas sp. NBT06-2 TaxID=2025950 RepID=UPI000BA6979B|nr:endonuclease domain-containing protein [Pseudoalteromonas sp. NBT06-2]PAJ75718.1 hypothetical protein CJF42_03550 [Pseudoalteromonas sp. NBT06-2]